MKLKPKNTDNKRFWKFLHHLYKMPSDSLASAVSLSFSSRWLLSVDPVQKKEIEASLKTEVSTLLTVMAVDVLVPVVALLYIERLFQAQDHLKIELSTVPRLWLAACVLAYKMVEDEPQQHCLDLWTSHSRSGTSLSQLAAAEREFMYLCGCRLLVKYSDIVPVMRDLQQQTSAVYSTWRLFKTTMRRIVNAV